MIEFLSNTWGLWLLATCVFSITIWTGFIGLNLLYLFTALDYVFPKLMHPGAGGHMSGIGTNIGLWFLSILIPVLLTIMSLIFFL